MRQHKRIFIGATMAMVMLWQGNGQAESKQATSDVVFVRNGSGVVDLAVHSRPYTVLYFDGAVKKAFVSEPGKFTVVAQDRKVIVRAGPELSAGYKGSLTVETATMHITGRLKVVKQAKDADLQLTFVPFKGLGSTRQRVDFQFSSTLGQVWVGDSEAGEQLDTTMIGGLSGRVSYLGSRYHAYELGVHFGQTLSARFAGIGHGRVEGDMIRNTWLTRLELGTRVQFPWRLSPVIRVAMGVQDRALYESRILMDDGSVFPGPGDRVFIDLTGTVGLGLDYRVRDTWSIGAGLNATRAMPLDGGPPFEAVEGAIHVSWL